MSLIESLNGKKKNQKSYSDHLLQRRKSAVAGGKKKGELWFYDIFLEREKLLSKIPGDPTIGILWSKKESCSTQRGLRVGSSFRVFRQTPRGRGFILLGFSTLFKCFIMFRLD